MTGVDRVPDAAGVRALIHHMHIVGKATKEENIALIAKRALGKKMISIRVEDEKST